MSAYMVFYVERRCQWHQAEALLTNGNKVLGVGSPVCPNTKVYEVQDKVGVSLYLCRKHIAVLEHMGAGFWDEEGKDHA